MFGKANFLAIFLNSFNKLNKNMSTHVRATIYNID